MKRNYDKLKHFRPLDIINDLRHKQEVEIIFNAIKKVFHGEDICDESLKISMENVEHYSIDVYTVRYKGVIVMQRFVDDIFNGSYRYESPLFDK